MFSVKGKVIVITGGAGFLGMQYCMALAEAGASVVIFDKEGSSALEKCVHALCAHSAGSAGYSVDITDERAVREIVRMVVARFGTIDALVNNAAMNPAVGSPEAAAMFRPYDTYDANLWRREIEVNLTGMQLTIQAVSPVMKGRRSGSIVNIASECGMIAYDRRIYGEGSGKSKSPAYIATKGAVIALTRAWAEELGSFGVRVNSFSPGGMQTIKHPQEFVVSYSYHNMLRRMAQPGEYNGIIQFLCSDASSFMTGHNLVADGGKTAW
ncbi:MAG: SDR family oxidoreductase [Parcubacteria group bacterium]|nr:SDR family oxidoreductase [Parcubacteria group bacterium]